MCIHRFLVEDPVASDDLAVRKVAQERERQLQRFGERLLREGQVRAHAEILDPEGFEPFEVGLPGQQVRRSCRNEVRAVELKEDELFAAKVAQRVGQFDLRRRPKTSTGRGCFSQ